jgi:hypothetical protein
MAKKIFKLDRFDGGLNNNSLARDIALDEVADISNLMVDEVGQIRLMGDFVDHAADKSQIEDFTPIASHNLFSYSTDFLANGNETGEDWVVFADSNASNGMHIYANSTDFKVYSLWVLAVIQKLFFTMWMEGYMLLMVIFQTLQLLIKLENI